MTVQRSVLNGFPQYYFFDAGNRQSVLKLHLSSASTPITNGFTTVSIGPIGQNAVSLTVQNVNDLLAALTYFAANGILP